MVNLLTKPEWEELGDRFNFTPEGMVQPTTSFIFSTDLLDREKCETYLDRFASEIGSPSRRVTASMLAKRYAYLTVTPVLYAMTAYNKGLHLTLGNCRLAAPHEDVSKSKFPNLSFEELSVTEPEAGKRIEWRNQVVSQLFESHLSQVFRSLSIAGQVPMAILWENALVRIIPIYEEGLEEEQDPSVMLRFQDDFQFISQTAPASLFGERRNPFEKFMRAVNAGAADNMVAYTRQTCCFYYEMSPEYCRACPKPLDCRP